MPSAAGDTDYYTFVLRDATTGEYHEDVVINLDRVTNVIGVLNKPFLVTWAHNFTRDAISGLVQVILEIDDLAERAQALSDLLDTLSDHEILEEYLKENRLRPTDHTADRADEGTEAHEFLERLATLSMVSRPRAMAMAAKAAEDDSRGGFIQAIGRWWKKTDPEVVASEVRLISLRLGVAGTCDLVWRDKEGKLWLTDLKSRKADGTVYESDRIQTGAYEIMWNESHEDKIEGRSVLLAKADGKYLNSTVTNDPTMFLDLLAVYRKGGK